MANTVWTVGDRKNSPYYREFICDSASDVANLPTNQKPQDMTQFNEKNFCATGSVAFVVETSDLYILKSDGTWTKI